MFYQTTEKVSFTNLFLSKRPLSINQGILVFSLHLHQNPRKSERRNLFSFPLFLSLSCVGKRSISMVLILPPHRLRHPTATRIRGRESLLCWLGHPAGTPPPPLLPAFSGTGLHILPHALRAFLEKTIPLYYSYSCRVFLLLLLLRRLLLLLRFLRYNRIESDGYDLIRRRWSSSELRSLCRRLQFRQIPGRNPIRSLLSTTKRCVFYGLIDCSVDLLFRSNFLSVYVFSRFRMSFEWFLGV